MTHANAPLPSVALTLLVLLTAGCGISSKTVSGPVSGSAFQGRAFGGQQPIAGGTIQLYAAGSTGYGIGYSYNGGPSSLIPNGSYFAGGAPGCVASSSQTCYPSVVTDGSGNFTITGDYTCPSAGTEVYLAATGGNPGLGAGGNNPNIALMAALGPCGNLGPNTYVIINELTTVASVWALSPFMTGISAVGTAAGNTTGLVNAFATVNKLVNIGAGALPGPALPPGATIPTDKLNLLADILAACVNTAGGVASDTTTPCGMLFSTATVNGTAPTDTIAAALNLAQNPNLGTSLSALVTKTAPFQPTLQPVPSDFGLVITYSGGALSTPSAIAADGLGNLWVSNAGNDSVSKLDALGASATDTTGFLSGTSGFKTGPLSGPTAVAIDQSGFVWITNGGNSTVARMSADGSASTLFQGGGLSAPSAVSIDANGNAWVANRNGASVTLINSSGTLSNFNGGGIASPSSIAIDPK